MKIDISENPATLSRIVWFGVFLAALTMLVSCQNAAPPPAPSPTAAPVFWVGDMSPGSGEFNAVQENEPFQVSVAVYKTGVTDQPGQGEGIACILHWGIPGQPWVDVPMQYVGDAPGLSSALDNDVYRGEILPRAGRYGFTARCEDQTTGKVQWQAQREGALIVTPPDEVPRTVFVHLFEWKWTDIAQECENFLGPKGFAAVQVSPPNEHIRHWEVRDFPWWARYQPVSYQLESRSGDRAQFIDMVQRCRAVGVDVYVDAVINHMTGGPTRSGLGVAGTQYSHFEYTDLYGDGQFTYSFDNFHHCGRNGNDDIANYQDPWEVRTCELLNLADLDTGSAYVQERIAAYLQDLVDIGVAGFRIDAAKHMDPADIAGILGRVQGDFYVFQEVIDRGGEPISNREYLGNGDVTEFNYGSKLSDTFINGKLAWLENFGESWGFLPTADAVVFVDNHDNQRGHGGGGSILTHRDGQLYTLADIFMLAWPYGYPRVMSSYAWDGRNDSMGPPSDEQGNTNDVYTDGTPNCFGDTPGEDWICEHRWPAVANMVAFHNVTNRNFFVTDWWSNGEQRIAFGRGDAGYVAINRESTPMTGHRFHTSMAPGRYCDVVHGELTPDGRGCTGPVIVVEPDGTLLADLAPMDALAIHEGARPK